MEKEAHLANMVKLAKVDGVIHPMESLFIQSLANRMDIDHDRLKTIIDDPDKISKVVPADMESRYRQFCELVILTQVDRIKNKDEKKLLKEMAEHLQIPAEKIKKLKAFLRENKMPMNAVSLLESL